MEQNCFIFDVNKCVGCQACVAGCIIENRTDYGINWRRVHPFNEFRHPDLPLFFYSLACNHCETALCMNNCPALAYSRDETTGAVIHHAEKCIGCRYCTWACPYDAPKFNELKRIVEKCNFCFERLKEGQKTACAAACPVGALESGIMKPDADEQALQGFVNTGIRPALKLIPRRNVLKKPVILTDEHPAVNIENIRRLQPEPESKIRLPHEWPLMIFTLLIAILTAWFGAHILTGAEVSTTVFLAAGIAGAMLSTLHLGVKTRAWRSILNLKGSWLSREVLGYSGFISLAAVYFFTGYNSLGIIGLVMALLAVISADRLYTFTFRPDRLPVHSAHIWLTTVLFFCWFSGWEGLVVGIMVVKLILYVFRLVVTSTRGGNLFRGAKVEKVYNVVRVFWFLKVLRVVSGVMVILLLEVNPTSPYWLVFAHLLITELIDRTEFYLESEVITPERSLMKAYQLNV